MLTRWIRSHLLTTRRRHDHGERWRTSLRAIRDLGCGVVQFALVCPGPATAGLCRAGNRFFQPDRDRRSNLVVAWSGDQRRLHGFSSAQLAIGPASHTENTTIQGFVATSGQITMVFTPVGGGTPTVGLGQMRLINGVWQMEMQMITGQNLLITHWAYMTPYNPATFIAAGPATNPCEFGAGMGVDVWHALAHRQSVDVRHHDARAVRDERLSERIFLGQRRGALGKQCRKLHAARLHHPRGQGALQHAVARHSHQPLWRGLRRCVRRADARQHLRSDRQSDRRMATISLVQPYAEVLAGQNNRAGLGALCARPDGVNAAGSDRRHGADICDPRQSRCASASNAVSQTLPVLAGAASQATYATQRALQQTVIGRLDDAYGLRTADAAAERNVWLKPLGGSPARAAMTVRRDIVRAAAACRRRRCAVSSRAVLGGLFSYAHQNITGSEDRAQRLGLEPISSGSMAPTR